VQSKVATVAQYLKALPADRRATLVAVADVVRANIDPRVEEGMQYGMIGWYVPHAVFPLGYHCDPKQPLPYIALAAQKHHCSLYLMTAYAEGSVGEAWIKRAWPKGKRLDMGKSCIRFKTLDDLALDIVAEAIRRVPLDLHIARYSSMDPRQRQPGARKPAVRTSAAKKPAAKRPASKRPASKRPAAKQPAAKRPASKRPAAKKK
jgi:hypothetical protein